MRWYVEPLASDQRVFNDSVLKLLDALSESADSAATAREQAERLVRELQERLERLERRGSSVGDGAQPPMTVASQPAAAAVPDYFAFESRMRGSTDAIRERQRRYVDDLRESAPVLDIGCGRGELLGLLREAGIEARGIDADADMVAYASGEGLDVEQADLVEYLERVHAGSLGGIFMGQVVEHLPAAVLVQALRLAASKLRPGGVLVAETINPLSPIALRNYFADLTHAQPLVPETLELLARQAGFAADRDPLPQRAGQPPHRARRPGHRRERQASERAPLRAARLRARRPDRDRCVTSNQTLARHGHVTASLVGCWWAGVVGPSNTCVYL